VKEVNSEQRLDELTRSIETFCQTTTSNLTVGLL